MTQEDLPELRLRIAKARGWRYYEIRPSPLNDAQHVQGHVYTGFYRPGEDNDNEYWTVTFIDKWPGDWMTRYCANEIPDWPRDIAAAWGLVEEMIRSETIIEVKRNPLVHRLPDTWYVETYSETTGQKINSGATAPEAICRAWLAWKEGQK